MDAGAVFRSAVFPPFDEARWRALAGKALAGASLETPCPRAPTTAF